MRNEDSYPFQKTTSSQVSSQVSSTVETTTFAGTADNLVEGMDSSTNTSPNQGVVNTDDKIKVVTMVKSIPNLIRKQVRNKQTYIPKSEKWPCKGILISFPEGTNQHTSFPFGIHSKHAVPWNY
jgi:hypothetical protein